MNGVNFIKGAAAVLGAVIAMQQSLHALPFNDDMVDVQKRTGVIMRNAVPGTVPVGWGEARPANKDESKKLTNPLKDDAFSAANGERLFRVNCYPCHGDIGAVPHVAGPASVNAKGVIPSINIGDKFYAQGDYANDGFIYGTIHFGGLVIMPPLGWKLSTTEHWDIVNYVRKAQRDTAAKVAAK